MKKRRRTQLPDGWSPTKEHRARAITLGVDLDREAEKFRLHAQATERLLANWNAGFTMWLVMSTEFTPPKPETTQPAWLYDDD